MEWVSKLLNNIKETVQVLRGRVRYNGYEYAIRKLTPKECWRLMGIKDEDFYKAEKVNSNTQLYKQAGNGIVVPVLEAIFGQMIENNVDYNLR